MEKDSKATGGCYYCRGLEKQGTGKEGVRRHRKVLEMDGPTGQ